MAVAYWQAGKLYAVGDLVQPIRSSDVIQDPLYNGDFEAGDTGWTKAADTAINTNQAYGGSYSLNTQAVTATPKISINDQISQVTPGTVVRATCVVKTPSAANQGYPCIVWYDGSFNILGYTIPVGVFPTSSTDWRAMSVNGIAPDGAEYAGVGAYANIGLANSSYIYFDNFGWSQAYRETTPYGVIFRATVGGYSGSAEPDWPTSVAATVVDNEVTWTAVEANRILWRAYSLAKSGSVEPTWPTGFDSVVEDNNFRWRLASLRVEDTNCPNTKQVAITAGKIFAGDNDIVAYCATNNALDWTTRNDAGYIPFGLNTYGAQPVSALGLYRSNLVVFNNKAFQMWQVDPDPNNFAILDAVPVGCPYFKSLQGVSNDLVFLTREGIRNMGIAGASTNLQAGFFGKQIDPLVKAALDAIADEDGIVSLYYPGAGQYWLIFDDEAFVLTMNGGSNDMSWSYYTFTDGVVDWTILNNELYLRLDNDTVVRVDEDAIYDSQYGTGSAASGDSIEGALWWPYLDFGALGVTKSLIGFDLVVTGQVDVQFGYAQNNTSLVTTAYTIADGDTLVGDIIPMPLSAPSIQMRLAFNNDEQWEWHAAALYFKDFRATS